MNIAQAEEKIQMVSSQLINLYERYVQPQLKSDKKKAAYIGSAVTATLLYYLCKKVLLPPKSLRNIPRIGYFTYVKSVLRNEDPLSQFRRYYAPLAAQGSGIYVRPNRLGWSVYVQNPAEAKKVFLKYDTFPKSEDMLGDKEADTLMNNLVRSPSILTEVGPSWKHHRQAANPASHRAMPVKLFSELTKQLFQVIDKENGTIKVSCYLERYAFDAITTTGFGYNANAIGDKNSEWVHLYTVLKDDVFSPFFFLFAIFDTTLRWVFPSHAKLHKDLDVFLSKIDGIVVEKREQISKQGGVSSLDDADKDLCTLMIEAESGEGGKLTNEEMMNDLIAFILAGHDTTANVLATAFYYLAVNKDVQQKLRNKAIEWLGDEPVDVSPTVEQTKTMPYVNMVIKETLRILGPAVWASSHVAAEDIELGGYPIPNKSVVTVDIMGFQHNEADWKEPYTFDPERFGPESENPKHNGSAWQPFGNGKRQCIGMNMILAEQRVLLVMAARRYEWSLSKDSIHKDGIVVSGMDIVGPKQLFIDFKKRF